MNDGLNELFCGNTRSLTERIMMLLKSRARVSSVPIRRRTATGTPNHGNTRDTCPRFQQHHYSFGQRTRIPAEKLIQAVIHSSFAPTSLWAAHCRGTRRSLHLLLLSYDKPRQQRLAYTQQRHTRFRLQRTVTFHQAVAKNLRHRRRISRGYARASPY